MGQVLEWDKLSEIIVRDIYKNKDCLNMLTQNTKTLNNMLYFGLDIYVCGLMFQLPRHSFIGFEQSIIDVQLF